MITGSAGTAVGVVSVIGVIGSLPELGSTITVTTEAAVTTAVTTLGNFILVLVGYRSLDIADKLEIFVDHELAPKLCHKVQQLVFQLPHFPQYLLS